MLTPSALATLSTYFLTFSLFSALTYSCSRRQTSLSSLLRRPVIIFSMISSGLLAFLGSFLACARRISFSCSLYSASTSSDERYFGFNAAICIATFFKHSLTASLALSVSASTKTPIFPPAWI